MIAEFEVLKMIKISILSDSVNSSQSHEFEDTSVETVISFLESEIHSLTDRLHVTNIQMNRSISLMIYKYENILQEQVKEYYDLLVPIFFNLRETENAYSQVLTENVKLVVNNTQKLIPKVFMSRFENRQVLRCSFITKYYMFLVLRIDIFRRKLSQRFKNTYRIFMFVRCSF